MTRPESTFDFRNPDYGPILVARVQRLAKIRENDDMSKFKVGDRVVRTSGGEWFRLREGDQATVTEVRPTPNNWCQIRVEGYDGLYSDFNFRLVRD